MFPRKAVAVLVAGLLSIAFWTVAIVTIWKGTFAEQTLAVLATSTTTLVAVAAAYLVPDKIEAVERKMVKEQLDTFVSDLKKSASNSGDKKPVNFMGGKSSPLSMPASVALDDPGTRDG